MKYKNTNKFAFLMGLIFLLALLLSSCSVQQMNNYHCKRCPTKDSVYIHVVTRDSMVPRDSIISVLRDSFIINFKDSVPCKDFEAEGTDQNGNRAKIIVKNNKASAECECAPFKAKIHWLEHHVTKLIINHKTLTRTIYEKTKRSWFSYWETWACIGAFLLWITIKILKLTGNFPISIKRSG